MTPSTKLAALVLVLVTVKSKSMTGVVRLVLLLPVALAGSPPPVTLAVLMTLGAAALATFTGNVSVVDVLPGATGVLLLQVTCAPLTVPTMQVQPAPGVGTAASVKPVGRVSEMT